jgi:hypothetical protein
MPLLTNDDIWYTLLMARELYYHCTFNAYLAEILTYGLKRNIGHRNWDFSSGDICLHSYPCHAESYCETAEDTPEHVFNSGIVVLEIDLTGWEDQLEHDPHIDYDADSEAYIFTGDVIPPSRISIYRENPYRRNADEDLRRLERRASSGDQQAQAALLAQYIRTDRIYKSKVRLAATFGHPVANLLNLEHYGEHFWNRLNGIPYLPSVILCILDIMDEVEQAIAPMVRDLVYNESVGEAELQDILDGSFYALANALEADGDRSYTVLRENLRHWAEGNLLGAELARYWCQINPRSSDIMSTSVLQGAHTPAVMFDIPEVEVNDSEIQPAQGMQPPVIFNLPEPQDLESSIVLDLAALAIFHSMPALGFDVGIACRDRIHGVARNTSLRDIFTWIIDATASRLRRLSISAGNQEYYKNRFTAQLLNVAILPEFSLPVPPLLMESNQRRNPAQFDVVEKAIQQIEQWENSERHSINGWVYGKEGEIYLRRIVRSFESRVCEVRVAKNATEIDIPNVDIFPEYQRQGVMKTLLERLTQRGIEIIKIEVVHNVGWFRKLITYEFPNYSLFIREEGSPSVYFVKNASIISSKYFY